MVNAMISVEISGLSEVQRIVKRFSNPDTYDRCIGEIVNETANLMRNMAPVADEKYTNSGLLEQSIRVIKETKNKYIIVVDVPYAIYMEYGTRYFPVGKPDSPRVRTSTSGKVSYHPFMRTAIWMMDKDYKKYFKRILLYK